MVGIYMIVNIKNNKVYIGQSRNIMKRISRHRCDLRRGSHKNKTLQQDFDMYGIDNFIFEALCECPLSQLNTLEQYYMICFESYSIEFGYNRQYGGDSGFPTLAAYNNIVKANLTTSCNTRNKLRKASMGNTNLLGKHHSDLTKDMIRNSLYGGDKKDYVRCVETGDTFVGITDAGHRYGVNPQGVSRCCRGKQKTCGGFHWEFIMDNVRGDK